MTGTVLGLLTAACRRWPDSVALTELAGGRRVTYRELAGQVAGRAAQLDSLGAGPGDVIALAAPEDIDTVAVLLACAHRGCVFLGLHPQAAPGLWRDQLAAARPRLLLTAGEVGAAAALVAASGVAASGIGISAVGPSAVTPLGEAPEGGDLGAPAPGVGPASTYQLVATSGSSGLPKLVRMVHRGSLAATRVYTDRAPLSPGATTAVTLSFASVGATHSGVLPAFATGGRVLLAGGAPPRTFVSALARARATFAVSVTAWWEACLADDGLRDLPDLRMIGVGGAPWAHLVPVLRERLPATRVLGIYGMTETHGPGIHATDTDVLRRPGVTGRPVAGLEVSVRDETGRPLPAGDAGRLWLRGPLVTPGYADGDRGAFDPEGWLCTGDVARADADGWVTVLDRLDDVVNLGGRKAYPAQVEAALRRHPAVSSCAAVRAEGPRGPVIAAFVVPAPGATLTRHDVRAWVRREVAPYAAPAVVSLRAELPRAGSGKVDRALLRARAAELAVGPP